MAASAVVNSHGGPPKRNTVRDSKRYRQCAARDPGADLGHNSHSASTSAAAAASSTSGSVRLASVPAASAVIGEPGPLDHEVGAVARVDLVHDGAGVGEAADARKLVRRENVARALQGCTHVEVGVAGHAREAARTVAGEGMALWCARTKAR